MNLLKKLSLIAASLIVGTAAMANASFASEKRCGWIVNPTPANIFLNDAHNEWIIGEQGGHQAKGADLEVPKENSDNFVAVNGGYGYWCGCVSGKFDKKTHQLTTIASSSVEKLKVCLEDQALKSSY